MRPLCNQEPAVAPAFEIDEGIDVVGASESAIATTIAAICLPVILPGDSAGSVACTGEVSAIEAGDGSRSNRLIPLIDRANSASMANTTPMPTRLRVSPSFNKS